ncbi:MAG: hypothetical protein LBE97_01775 [Holosporales bacterium]|jgi:hypothetical protein|nr:hypothetical protein [Holosporales bacterium]
MNKIGLLSIAAALFARSAYSADSVPVGDEPQQPVAEAPQTEASVAADAPVVVPEVPADSVEKAAPVEEVKKVKKHKKKKGCKKDKKAAKVRAKLTDDLNNQPLPGANDKSSSSDSEEVSTSDDSSKEETAPATPAEESPSSDSESTSSETAE